MRSRHFWMNLSAALLMAVCFLPTSVRAQSASRTEYQISAGDLDTALKAFAAQSHMQISYPPELVRGKTTPAVSGGYSPAEALRELLSGTGLVAEAVNASTFVLKRLGPPAAPKVKSITAITSSPGDAELEEVVVSAQKRGDERLQTVPIPISVINADALADTEQVLFKDYFSSVPGLSIDPEVNGIQNLSIRGIANGGGNPTVGVLVDGVPYGGSGTNGGNEIPDIDPGDLARTEVLRGPQGTLYGDNSMGGIINFITKTPSFDESSGRVEVGTSDVYSGAQPGYNVRASANIPLSDSLGIRVSGFERQDPGYIDNPILNLRGVNETQSDGARLAALWRPMDGLSVALSALYQYTKSDGASVVIDAPGLGDLQQNYAAGTGGENRRVQAYSAIINAKLGSADLVSITGYNIDDYNNSFDFSSYYGQETPPMFPTKATPLDSHFVTYKFSQELRLSGSVWNNLDWLVGGFYTHEDTPDANRAVESNPLTGQIIGSLGYLQESSTLEEYAGFANLTYHFTDRIDVQIGGRESEVDVKQPVNVYTGIFSTVNPATEAKANTFTYLVTPRFQVSPDLMIYARFASGFRPGTANSAYVAAQGYPAQQAPDKTQNYELGFKGDFLSHVVSVDASVYYIDWKEIQLTLVTPHQSFSYGANGGSAKSEGVDLSVTARPLTGLTVTSWVAYDDAALTQSFPVTSSVYGVAGDRLPYAARFSGMVSFQQEFPLWSKATGFAGGAVTFVGDRTGQFDGFAADGVTPLPRQDYPSYTKTDLRAGVKQDSWTTSVYVNNLTNRRGVLSGGQGSYIPPPGPYAFVLIQSRTVGLNVSKSF